MDGNFDPQTGEVRDLPAVRPQTERNLIFSSPACDEVFGALCEAQGKMENPKKTKTATVKGRARNGNEYDYSYAYAPLDEIHGTIREPLSAAGLVHRQFLAQRDGLWMMRTIIAHRSGQWYGCDYPIFWDESRGMQGFASGVTYARRYGLMLALGLVGEDDDDANVADGNQARFAGPSAARSEGRTAQGGAGRGMGAPHTPQAAPAPSEARAEADKRYKELRGEIDASMTVKEVGMLVGCPAWVNCRAAIVKSELEGGKDAATAEGVATEAMQRLTDRAERRKEMLLADAEPVVREYEA